MEPAYLAVFIRLTLPVNISNYIVALIIIIHRMMFPCKIYTCLFGGGELDNNDTKQQHYHPSQVPAGALSPLLITRTHGLVIISIKSPDGVSTSKGTVQYLQENMIDQDIEIREGFNKLSNAN